MARDIAGGYILVTERTFKPFDKSQLDKFQFELERIQREIRAEQPDLEDLKAVQDRQRRLQRVRTALMMARAFRTRMKR